MIKYVMSGTPEENLKVVFAEIKKQYGIMHIPNADRYPTMKLTQIKTAKASLLPKLKGTGQQCPWKRYRL